MTPDVFNELCANAGVQHGFIEQLKRELEDEGLLLHHEERVYLRSPVVARAVAEAVDETSKLAPAFDVRTKTHAGGRSVLSASADGASGL